MQAAAAKQAGGWRQWVEPWYLPYALAGASTGGLVGILLPLAATQEGGASYVGVVMAAVSAGMLSAVVWGGLADRLHAHRAIFGGGILLAAVAVALLALEPNRAVSLLLALAIGAGNAAYTTVANLLVVEAHPKAEWNLRLGWLQTFYGGGLALGLLLASPLSRVPPREGLVVTAVLAALAGAVGWWLTRALPPSAKRLAVPQQLTAPADWAHGAVEHTRRHSLSTFLSAASRTLRSRFGVFLAVVVVANVGLSGVYALFPLMMQRVFDVDPSRSSVVYSVGMWLGLTLYSPAGQLSNRYGAARVFQASVAVRMLAVSALALLGVTQLPGRDWLALLAFLPVTLGYATMSVSSTSLASELSSADEGAGMGLFNASSGLTQLVGTATGGWVAHTLGYNALSVFAAAALGAGLALALLLPKR